eukprot:scaffold30888_cov73-Isochrysis_galbana.AAC.1
MEQDGSAVAKSRAGRGVAAEARRTTRYSYPLRLVAASVPGKPPGPPQGLRESPALPPTGPTLPPTRALSPANMCPVSRP